jgi:hypothetical protein
MPTETDKVINELRDKYIADVKEEEEITIIIKVPPLKHDYIRLIRAIAQSLEEIMMGKLFQTHKQIFIHISYEK